MGASNTAITGKRRDSHPAAQQVKWGRTSNAGQNHNLSALFLITMPVLLVHLNWVALEHFNGSLSAEIGPITSQGLIKFARSYFPQPSTAGFLGYGAWILLQALLYNYLPGKLCFGQRTPGGHLLSYTTNGVTAWAVTHLLYLAASVLGIIDPALVAKHWPGLFVAADIYGFLVAILAQLRGYWAPTYPEDCKRTGEWLLH